MKIKGENKKLQGQRLNVVADIYDGGSYLLHSSSYQLGPEVV